MNRHHERRMSEPVSRRTRATSGALLVIAVAAVIAAHIVPTEGTAEARVLPAAAVALAGFVAAFVIASANRFHHWNGHRAYVFASFTLGITGVGLAILAGSGRSITTLGPTDLLFLLYLPPLFYALRAELHDHFPPQQRVEFTADVLLITVSLASVIYLVIVPPVAGATAQISAATWAVLAAAQVAMFSSLMFWEPSRDHIAQAISFGSGAVAAAGFGLEWIKGTFTFAPPVVTASAACSVLGLAATAAFLRRGPGAEHAARRTQPIISNGSVVTAFAALVTVAIMQNRYQVSDAQEVAIIAALGLGVTARIVMSQTKITVAHRETRSALAAKELALHEADQALDRVREANETLRQSEEHLRLVFEAAVDGIVELDERDTILRANDAFCGMVGLDRTSVEGQPWTALAAAITGTDAGFASLPTTGAGLIERMDGQALYLESRSSDIPMDPPRRLLLVRDVTAGRVADQTIRSLFQFLQDRDEDRTRLLRRTNAAIESERNRIARDLHDGPVQGVSAASLSLEAALLMIKAGDLERGTEVLTKIRKELAEEADSLRALMSGLRPPVLEERGLIPALRETLARFGTDHDVVTTFNGALAKPIPRDLETLAYRVVQEALSNAGKHAGARRINVHVQADLTQLRIEIEDDGSGFDSARAREFLHQGRVGLASMRERVELASGSFVVRSSLGRGTTILATLPVEAAPALRELAVDEAR
jgi:signal transduction histidine kinase